MYTSTTIIALLSASVVSARASLYARDFADDSYDALRYRSVDNYEDLVARDIYDDGYVTLSRRALPRGAQIINWCKTAAIVGSGAAAVHYRAKAGVWEQVSKRDYDAMLEACKKQGSGGGGGGGHAEDKKEGQKTNIQGSVFGDVSSDTAKAEGKQGNKRRSMLLTEDEVDAVLYRRYAALLDEDEMY